MLNESIANFIDFELGVENPTNDPDDVVSEYSDSPESFIDDDEEDDAVSSFYHKFKSVNISVDETLDEEYKKSLIDIQNLECSNFCEMSEEEGEVDKFKDVEKRVDKFKETLLPLPSENENENVNLFVNAILFAIRFDLEEKANSCSLNDLRQELPIEDNLFLQLNEDKFSLVLYNQKFNTQCHKINGILAAYGYFLRIFELKEKFHHLIIKNFKKLNIVRQLSTCITEQYNGFPVTAAEYSKKNQKKI